MALFSRKRQTQALVAAGSRVPIQEKGAGKAALQRRQAWQPEAWAAFDDVGELKDLVTRIGNALRRVRLFAADLPTDTEGDPTPTKNAAAIDALDRLRSIDGTHGNIMDALGVNFSVAGEGYLVGREGQNEDEDWAIFSTQEVTVDGSGNIGLKDPDSGKTVPLGEEAFVGRLWISHKAFRDKADSPLHGVLNVCDQLNVLDKALWVARRNRAVLRGILVLGTDQTPGPADPTQEGDERRDPFMAGLEEHLSASMNRDSMASASPLVIRLDDPTKAQLIALDDKIEGLLEEQTQLIKRLAQGMSAPPEYVTGLGSASHWNAWQITEERYTDYLEPLVHLICGSLTSAWLHPYLQSVNVDPKRLLVWADPSNLIIRPDRTKDAFQAHDALLISDAAARRDIGFDDVDAPGEEELIRRMALKRGITTEQLTRQLLQETMQDVDIPDAPPEEDPTAGTGGDGSTPEQPPGNGPPPEPEDEGEAIAAAVLDAVSEPRYNGNATIAAAPPKGKDIGKELMEIDRALKTRLHIAADAALSRALERAGTHIRGKAQRDSSTRAVIKGKPADQVAMSLGPAMVAALGLDEQALLRESLEPLQPKFDAWVTRAQDDARARIPNLSEGETQTIQARQLEDGERSWEWFLAALVSFAGQRLYDPSPDPAAGEFDTSITLPYGIVREAVARAGGEQIAPSSAVGGIATGAVIMDVFKAQGATQEGFVWEYGAFPRNTYEPHADLDGTEFVNFDDPILASPDGAFGGLLFPGDHTGCFCDARPIVIVPEQPAELALAAGGNHNA